MAQSLRLGLPGLAGFWGEFMALLGAFNPLEGRFIVLPTWNGKRGIGAYQVWNEANVKNFWTGSPMQMATLTKAAWNAVKGVDSGALVVGPAVAVTDAGRAALAERLSGFAATLSRGGTVVDRGSGATVLGSPALALGHLARVRAGQPQFAPRAAGEIVTTGTLTDAWPVQPGETWSSDYGDLGLPGLTLRFD